LNILFDNSNNFNKEKVFLQKMNDFVRNENKALVDLKSNVKVVTDKNKLLN